MASSAWGDDAVLTRFRDRVEPVLVEFCHGCHGDGMSKGNVTFEDYETGAALLAKRDMWHAVLRNVRSGVMPPAGEPRPSAKQRQELFDWILRDAFGTDPKYPDPGRVTIRRLNRVEYRNTIRDLMQFDFRTDEEFPPDDTGYGFDTIGDVLSVSPLLLEKYMQAAETIVTGAVPTIPRVVREQRLSGEKFREGDEKGGKERLSFYEKSAVGATFRVDMPGDYRLRVALEVNGDFDFDPGRCRVVFRVDGVERLNQEFGWHNHKEFPFDFDLPFDAGEHALSFELEPLVPLEQKKRFVDLRIQRVNVQGPLDPRHWVATKNYDRYFSREEPPQDPAERAAYAKEILSRFAARAFRRPVEGPLVDRLVKIAESVYERPDTRFEQGIAQALVAVLASPRFVFRVEEALPAGDDPVAAPVDDYALATRLSYFLWSTLPDDELLRLAELGILRQRLGPQVRRMLADARADAFVENFVGQWLQTRDVPGVQIDARVVLRREGIRSRDEVLDFELRRALRRETEMCFAHVARGNRSVLELLDSDYTFANEKLAKHYGLPAIEGREMRRIELPPESPRGGVLTHGSVLLVTSNPTRTSPVKRGLFVLDNILGTPPPPPPPDVPELEAAEKALRGKDPTMREIMELHRQKPLCNACHARMDPLGLALENFNALGMWRTAERGQPIDTKGQLITGEGFKEIGELKRVLTGQRRKDFYRCLAEKLMIYALGRGLEYHDEATIERIVEKVDRDKGRFSTLLMGIVESAPFQKRRHQKLDGS
jgi:Protein of unknown function (DUF1592)/Protein of unknown function (DUF1588)/Protein of unknown function (DUF1587)/Protein of unknown function (DUF1585)/Protein of unknown function (DUF1595)/Cytochrome C oxidase, cbb3-type, subunit III